MTFEQWWEQQDNFSTDAERLDYEARVIGAPFRARREAAEMAWDAALAALESEPGMGLHIRSLAGAVEPPQDKLTRAKLEEYKWLDELARHHNAFRNCAENARIEAYRDDIAGRIAALESTLAREPGASEPNEPEEEK